MSTVQEIEEAISHLSPDDFKAFRAWFEEYENQRWDYHLENWLRKPMFQRPWSLEFYLEVLIVCPEGVKL